jgi:aconitate hydratase
VIAETFERIHRSNLIGMGILPLQFGAGENAQLLGLTGEERYTIHGLASLVPGQNVEVRAVADDGHTTTFTARARVDNETEISYLHHGGILPLVLRQLIAKT